MYFVRVDSPGFLQQPLQEEATTFTNEAERLNDLLMATQLVDGDVNLELSNVLTVLSVWDPVDWYSPFS